MHTVCRFCHSERVWVVIVFNRIHCLCTTASKNPRLAFDEVVDDVLPLSLAQRLRERLRETTTFDASTSTQPADNRKARGKKVDHLYSRSTSEFVNCVKSLTPLQKEAVEELGFGPILHFDIKEIPGYLSYWVLNAFNLPRCQIPLSGGATVDLDEDDVHLTLGFPRGGRPITKPVDRQTDFRFNDYVADRCGKRRFKLTSADVEKLITEEVNGGPNFKRMFMFMLENAVIETSADGYLKPKILHFIDDVDEIRNMSWCSYVLSMLEATYPTWFQGENVNFTGPIHFLICAYVDRVVHVRRRVSRAWPTIKCWTTETLKQREEAERDQFGAGRLDCRLDKAKYLMDEEAHRLEAFTSEAGADSSTHLAKRIRDKFIKSSTVLGNAISTWLDDFKMIPIELMGDDCIRVGSEIGHKLLGMGEENLVEDAEIVTRLTQARDDEEEYSQAWIDDMERMMAAYDKKKTIARGFSRPSFVLEGFDFPDPFATQQTQGRDGAGGSGVNKNNVIGHNKTLGGSHGTEG